MKVKLETKTIEITKLPIGRYAEFLTIIKSLFAKADMVTSLVSLSNEQFLSQLPEIFVANLPEFLKLIHIGSGLPEEEVATLGLSECIDLIVAIFEVNKYADVYEKIKKGLARLPKANTQVTPTGLSTQ